MIADAAIGLEIFFHFVVQAANAQHLPGAEFPPTSRWTHRDLFALEVRDGLNQAISLRANFWPTFG